MADLETEVPRLFELWLSLVEVLVVVEEDDAKEEQVAVEEEFAPEQVEPVFAALVDVPRDFFVGGSSRQPTPFIEFRLP